MILVRLYHEIEYKFSIYIITVLLIFSLFASVGGCTAIIATQNTRTPTYVTSRFSFSPSRQNFHFRHFVLEFAPTLSLLALLHKMSFFDDDF